MKTATTHPSDPLGLAFSRAERLFPGYEQRPQQQQMAQSIRETLASRGSLLIEAPTGVGKSIGYLLPSILEAIEHQRKAVISTHTKNLQEQLLLRDIPLASRLLDCHCSAIALKGRHNYLCPTRLDAAISAKSGMFGPSTLDALEDLARWSTSTSSGDLEEYPEKLTNEVRELVASEQGVCNPRACRGRCFFQRSREAARAASVVILNHALFFQMLSKGDDEDRLVYENDFVVFDEAHTLERVASSSLGIRLMRGAALRPLTRMLHQVQGRALFGRRVRSAQKHVRTALEAIEDLFDELVRESARGVKGKASREIRVREPDLVEDRVTSPMRTVIDLIQDAASDLPMLPGLEVTPLVTSLESTITAISTFLHQEEPESAYWIESGESPTNVTLCVSPLNVADILRTRLFRPGVSIVMTSAT